MHGCDPAELGAARQWAFGRRGLDVSADGLPPGTRARVCASVQAHNTIRRVTAVLGLGRAGTRRSACDARAGSMWRRRGPRSPPMSVTEWSDLEGSFSSGEEDAVVQFGSAGIPCWDLGAELPAPSRGVLAWAVLREPGRAGVAARVERHIGFARHLAQRAR